MPWDIQFHPDLAAEFEGFAEEVQDAVLAHLIPLAEFGPTLGRPLVDTLKGSRLANLKELRFAAGDGAWRVAFVFDRQRIGVLLAAGDKSGVKPVRFYKMLVKLAEERFANWE